MKRKLGVTVIEQLCESKTGDPAQNEDCIVVTDRYLAVIDGATGKTNKKFQGQTGGRIAAQFLAQYLQSQTIPKQLDGHAVVARMQEALCAYAKEHGLEEQGIHLCASAVLYDSEKRQIWSVGDCQFMINDQLFTFPKKVDQVLSQTRAAAIHMLLCAGYTQEQLQGEDLARNMILDALQMQQYLENQPGPYGYSVFSGKGKVSQVVIVDVPAGSQVVLASDGYPMLYQSLAESEAKLKELLLTDPLCYQKMQSTKGVMSGQYSFDDRSYIRFKVCEKEI